MINDPVTAEYNLTDGLTVSVKNATRHYYGGYYHVRLLATADIPLSAEMFDSQSVFDQALKHVGLSLRFERVLEKMAVPESDIEVVRQNLLLSFQTNVLPYLLRKDFPSRFVRTEYEKILKSRTLLRGKMS